MPDLIKKRELSTLPQAYQPEQTDWAFAELEEDHVDLRHYFQILRKRKWLILAIVSTVLAGVAVQTFSTTPLYRSSARIQIDPELANILPYKEVYEPSSGYYGSVPYLATQLKILQSRSLARRVIRRLNLSDEPAFNASVSGGFVQEKISSVRGSFWELVATFAQASKRAAAKPEQAESPSDVQADVSAGLTNRFLGNLGVTTIGESRLVEVSYSSPDPQFAAKAVNTLAEEFIEQNFEIKYEATTKATDFLERQLHGLKIKVERSEEELINYARAQNILTFGGGESIILQNLTALNEELTSPDYARTVVRC